MATRLALIAGVLVLLQHLSRTGAISTYVMPAPSEIAKETWSTIGSAQFRQDFTTTAREMAGALLVALPLGFLLGVLFWRVPVVGAIFEPFLATLYAVPIMVFYPILLVWLGLGSSAIICLAAVIAVVPVALNTTLGLRSIPPALVKLADSAHCSAYQRYKKVYIPAALPYVISGIQLSFVFALIITIAMEFLAASAGLGYRISQSYIDYSTLHMWAGIVLVAAVAIVAVSVINRVAARVRSDLL